MVKNEHCVLTEEAEDEGRGDNNNNQNENDWDIKRHDRRKGSPIPSNLLPAHHQEIVAAFSGVPLDFGYWTEAGATFPRVLTN